MPDLIIGHRIWDFITGSSASMIYGNLFSRIRDRQTFTTFPFRCDSPEMRRFLEMRIECKPERHLRFAVSTVRLEPRERVPVLDPSQPRSDEMLRVCAWCKRTPDDRGVWIELEIAMHELAILQQSELPIVTHGICEDCVRLMSALEDERDADGWLSALPAG